MVNLQSIVMERVASKQETLREDDDINYGRLAPCESRTRSSSENSRLLATSTVDSRVIYAVKIISCDR
ncbi:hypothetical protein FOMPIDRAFT_161575 [Fomitopsis schrenkii]|uniref:Uncharacterized protein n=1 Tax=Fomitopsis schrenkii TaxID=2126942 RepID=S8FMB5_FOMSC|nr:hypothetical protein FOMPIDRAFT_161575 [Fomitopsis schrenkii]